jgi:flavin-dependent dehydrogenase
LHFYAPNGAQARLSIPTQGDWPTHLVVLPRFQLDHLILQQAERAGAHFRPQTQAVALLREGEEITGVAVRSGHGRQELRARYLVLATGAAIGLLEQAQLSTGRWQSWRAARGYYDGVSRLEAAVEVHLETAILPGYAWVFPTSPTSANIGAAYLAAKNGATRHSSPRQAVDEFVASPLMAGRLAGARLNGQLRGYPIRFDFASTPVAFPGLMLIGETAGLVNPLTGEGIDYALESAVLTAETLARVLRQPTAPAEAAAAHTRALRARFQSTFVTLARVRHFFLHRWLLNRAGRVANHNEAFCRTIADVLLGNIDPAHFLTPKIVRQLILG